MCYLPLNEALIRFFWLFGRPLNYKRGKSRGPQGAAGNDWARRC